MINFESICISLSQLIFHKFKEIPIHRLIHMQVDTDQGIVAFITLSRLVNVMAKYKSNKS